MPKTFFDEFILVETNRMIKGLDIRFGEFLRLIGIWMLMTANPSTNQAKYFIKNPIDLFVGCSICVNQFVSGIFF